MIRYTLRWTTDAEDQLAGIWMKAADRPDVNDAQQRIDAELEFDAHRKGDEVAEGLRQLTIPPLRAYFEIDEDGRQVQVTAVARIG